MEEFVFEVIDFGGIFKCSDIYLGQINSTCSSFSYIFRPGVYALTGDINDGGWAFAHCLTGESQLQRIDENAEIFVNKKKIDFQLFSERYVQNLGMSRHYKKIDKMSRCTVRSIVSHNLKKSHLSITTNNICALFGISPDRFDKTIQNVGFELPLCKAAIGFSAQKKVFVFPFVTKKLYPSTIYLQKICDTLRQYGCIVLIPIYECDWIRGIYDTEINIQKIFLEKARAKTGDG